jgi:hypothetical protein
MITMNVLTIIAIKKKEFIILIKTVMTKTSVLMIFATLRLVVFILRSAVMIMMPVLTIIVISMTDVNISLFNVKIITYVLVICAAKIMDVISLLSAVMMKMLAQSTPAIHMKVVLM